MKWNKTLLAAAGVIAIAAGTVAANGQAGFNGHGGGPAHRLEMLSTALDLTEAQKAFAKATFEEARTAAQPIMAQLKQGHEAVAAAVKAGKPEAEMSQLAASQGTLMSQMAVIHAKAMARFYNQLTPEQKTKADQLHSTLKGMFERRFRFAGGSVH